MIFVINFYLFYKFLNSKICIIYIKFQHTNAIKMFENFVNRRNLFVSLKKIFFYIFDYMIMYTKKIFKKFNYHIKKINEKIYCKFCKQNENVISKRKTLIEMNFNDKKIKWIRFRFFQINFTCLKCKTTIWNIDAC